MLRNLKRREIIVMEKSFRGNRNVRPAKDPEDSLGGPEGRRKD